MANSFLKINWEKMGVAASLACAIHCAIVPLFFTSLPLFGINLVHNEAFEFSMLGVALVIGLSSLRHGFRWHHHRYVPILLFVTGIGFLAVKEFVPGHPLWMILVGVVFILASHYFNYKLCRTANHCHSSDCNH